MANSQEIDISIGVDAILKRGFLLLEEHQWKKAQRHFDAAIEIAPENAYSYLGRLLVTLKLPNSDSLINSPRAFTGSENYKKAYLYANDDLKNKLDNCVSQYQSRCEKDYQYACSLLEKAFTKEDFYECSHLFYKLGNYKDSSKKREYCSNRFSEFLNNSRVVQNNVSTESKIKKSRGNNIFAKLWNNNNFMIVLTFLFLVPACLVFAGDLLLPIIISVVIVDTYVIYIFVTSNGRENIGKAIFIATIAAFVFGMLLGLICGIELYPDNGTCGICGGSGIFGSKICPFCGGWG